MHRLIMLGIISFFAVTTQVCRASSAEENGWKLSSQCWTWRNFTFFETVDILHSMNVKYIEVYEGQPLGGGLKEKMGINMSAAAQKKVLATVKEKGMKIINFGVTKADRKHFQWAKSMGIETIVAEPAIGNMAAVDALCHEFNIRVALHNHPKPSRYWNPDTVLKACEGRSNMIGACADIGHWARSGLVPLECIKKLKGRIISLHFKDLNEFGVKKAYDVPWGTGICNVDGILRELQAQNFKGVFSMEYEKADADLKDNAQKCVTWFNQWSDKQKKQDEIQNKK